MSAEAVKALRQPSLLRSLVLRLTAVVVVGVFLGIVMLVLQFRDGITGIDDQSIAVQAQNLRGMVVVRDGAPRLQLSAELQSLYADPRSYNGYQLLAADGRVLESGGFTPPFIPLPTQPQDDAIIQREHDAVGDYDVLAATVSLEQGNGSYWIRVVRSFQDLESISGQLVLRVLPEFTPMLVVVLLSIILVVVLTIHGALRPIREVSRQAAALSAARLGERLPDARIPREVAPLVRAINSSLDKLEKDYEAQREFTAHAAHELRTPLAILRARLEAKFPVAELGDVGMEIDALGRLVEQLLCLAQLDSEAGFPTAPLDAHACAVEVARDMAPLALAGDHAISADTPAATVHTIGNATLVRMVFRNLVENAIRHTPAGTSISVFARDAHTVVVVDSGPGIPVADRAHVFDRFRRGSRATSPGAGLGLAIARRIMERSGGRLELDASEQGACFVVSFSPSSSDPGAAH